MKNKYKVLGEITVIILNSRKHGRKETVIDTDKLDLVKGIEGNWTLHWAPNTRTHYCRAQIKEPDGKVKTVPLHRLIMGFPKGKLVDHINHDTLDNTSKNLREATHSENLQNRSGANRNSTSGVRGVYWHKQNRKWLVKMKVYGKYKNFGLYDTIKEAEEEAKKARAQHMPFSKEHIG